MCSGATRSLRCTRAAAIKRNDVRFVGCSGLRSCGRPVKRLGIDFEVYFQVWVQTSEVASADARCPELSEVAHSYGFEDPIELSNYITYSAYIVVVGPHVATKALPKVTEPVPEIVASSLSAVG